MGKNIFLTADIYTFLLPKKEHKTSPIYHVILIVEWYVYVAVSKPALYQQSGKNATEFCARYKKTQMFFLPLVQHIQSSGDIHCMTCYIQ